MFELTHEVGEVAIDRSSMNENPMSDFWKDLESSKWISKETQNIIGINKKILLLLNHFLMKFFIIFQSPTN